MTEEKQTKKRRPFYLIINKEFQLSFTFYFVMMMLLSVFFLWATVSAVFQLHVSIFKEETAVYEVLSTMAGTVNYFFFWEGVFIIALSALLGLFVSRRVSGPLYRVEEDLKSFNNDEKIREIRIRKNDYFKSLVNELNAVFDKLKKAK